MDCGSPDFSERVHGILQARILKWAAVPFSRGSSWPRDRTQVSPTAGRFFFFFFSGRFFTVWATWEALSRQKRRSRKDNKIPLDEGRPEARGTRLRSTCSASSRLPAPTLLHSWAEISYLTLSPANWSPHPTWHAGNAPRPWPKSKNRSNIPKALLSNLCLPSPPAHMDLRQVSNTQIPLPVWPWKSYLTPETSGKWDGKRFYNPQGYRED